MAQYFTRRQLRIPCPKFGAACSNIKTLDLSLTNEIRQLRKATVKKQEEAHEVLDYGVLKQAADFWKQQLYHMTKGVADLSCQVLQFSIDIGADLAKANDEQIE